MTLARKSLSDMLPSTSSTADIAAAAAAASRDVDEAPPAQQPQQRLAAVPYQAPEATKIVDSTASTDNKADTSPIEAVSAEVTAESSTTEAPVEAPPAKPFTRTKRSSRTGGQQAQTSAEPAQPKYMTLARKEARLREDQVDDLSMLARKLSRAARGGEERITDNTLIRVAVDLLLAQRDKLAGSTEEELRKSLMK